MLTIRELDLFAASPFLDHTNNAYVDGDPALLLEGFFQYFTASKGVVTTSPVQALSFFSTENYLKRVSERKRTRPPPPNMELHLVRL